MSENGDALLYGARNFEPNFGDANFSKSFPTESQMFHTIPSDYKISLPPSMETQIRKLKLSLESWRELILQVNNILLWEKPWHSTALLSASSILFTILWLLNPNFLTVISIIGLLITLSDYMLPVILVSVFKSETWTKEKQKYYEEICTNIIMYKTKVELICSSYCRLRVTNPKLYFSVTIFTLCCLTWLGGTVDNLFLTFLTCTFLIMLPGMLRHGMLIRFSETFSKLVNDLIENAKSKVTQKKIQ